MAYLPLEILSIICTYLSYEQDFKTLFSCACAGKELALVALSRIYCMHNVVLDNGGDMFDINQQENRFWKSWLGVWRTVIRSSLGKTMYPYCYYLRNLNLGELEEILKDLDSKTGVEKKFKTLLFQGEGADLVVKTKGQIFGPNRLKFDALATTNRIGTAIIKQAPLLEELTGNIFNEALLQWVPLLPRLRYLNLWHGSSLINAGNLIRAHCPLFSSLKFWSWRDDDADHQLAVFLGELRPQSLECFENFCYSDIGPEAFGAFDPHRESLSELILTQLKPEATLALPLLKGCTNLVYLSLQEYSAPPAIPHPGNEDLVLNIVAWVKQCKNLRAISLNRFRNSFAIATPLLLDNTIPLTRLEIEGDPMQDCMEFYRALAFKTSLRALSLAGDADEQGIDAADLLLASLCKLVNLEDLSLKDASDFFGNEAIMGLARSLPKLESLWSSGFVFGDAIWDDIASLKSLRKLEFYALTEFTAQGIYSFISKLGSGNRGFSLSILMEDPEYNLLPDEISRIREMLMGKLDGRFEFALVGEPSDGSSFELESG